MLIGHYAVGFAAKRTAPMLSLGALFLAVEFLDHLWPILVLADIERVRVVPGITAMTPLDFEHYAQLARGAGVERDPRGGHRGDHAIVTGRVGAGGVRGEPLVPRP